MRCRRRREGFVRGSGKCGVAVQTGEMRWVDTEARFCLVATGRAPHIIHHPLVRSTTLSSSNQLTFVVSVLECASCRKHLKSYNSRYTTSLPGQASPTLPCTQTGLAHCVTSLIDSIGAPCVNCIRVAIPVYLSRVLGDIGYTTLAFPGLIR